MILPDDPPKPAPGQTQPRPQVDVGTSAPPPAYPGYPSYQRDHQPELYPGPGSGTPIEPLTQIRYTEPAGERFFRAFAVAAAIYILLGLFTSSIIELGHWTNARRGRVSLIASFARTPRKIRSLQWNIDTGKQIEPVVPWPRENDGHIIECHHGYGQWDHDGIMPAVTLDLPLTSDLFYVFSRGILTKGSFTFMESPFPEQRDVRVEISMRNTNAAAFEAVTICKLERDTHHIGVGTPLTPPAAQPEPLDLFVTVTFPRTRVSPLHIPALEVALPLFTYTIPKVPEDVTFGSVAFTSSNVMILVEVGTLKKLVAEDVTLKTSNGVIWGDFEVSRSIRLETSNALIRTNITAYHDNARQSPTEIKMRTSNYAITSDVKLMSTAADTTGGSFDVDARTSNGFITLQVPEIPVDSTINVDARTSNKPARVALGPAYEGEFLLRTSNASPSVKRNDRAEDPSGQGRRRRLFVSQVKGNVQGEVLWGDKRREGTGNVQIRSSNREVVLDLL
ncbi:hypothetical protein OBBRIDRAFT_724741 [Obba rivulosa]|uniref:Uncharacterized protein n=1 Tax=Obba rivulosa TaxID=1052685 RepID=A0A8E2DPT7_9APHY|nr:hypothetical protein OBBRIDRAFT_724741 [Obba rivulosa]